MEEYIIIYSPFITVKGKRIFASSYGLKAFRLRIPKSRYVKDKKRFQVSTLRPFCMQYNPSLLIRIILYYITFTAHLLYLWFVCTSLEWGNPSDK